MCKVFDYDLERNSRDHFFKYCLGFMGTPIDLLLKPMFFEYDGESVVTSPEARP